MNAILTITLAMLAAAACAQAAPSHDTALSKTATKALPPILACYLDKSLVYAAGLNYYCWLKAKLLIDQQPVPIITYAECVFTGIVDPESTGFAPVFDC